jgi:hypothetical protein
MKVEFSQHVFEKYSDIIFHENPSSGSELFNPNGWTDRLTKGRTYRRTDTHDEGNSRFSQFCERAKKCQYL